MKDLQSELLIHKRKLSNKLVLQPNSELEKSIINVDRDLWKWRDFHYRERRSYSIEKAFLESLEFRLNPM